MAPGSAIIDVLRTQISPSALGVTCILILCTLLFLNSENSLYKGFEPIGVERNAWTYGEARKRYITNAKSILWEGLEKV
ncbi:uncharacterized protein Z518_11330 [Rhinocladiella mackenziei CBS 650.93]|uniref:Uncharacterized protein n=1 Tax=Rhinocladiella mackenziei CBS 650.93 TaxID=1442369 RepID=A0A0D2FBW3_9EURO|nr:uncharacterized protein Z518_11330 [Rhinocladiella mackenziei CBS 650.93]KIW99591.1 hypothetical protein Z518_11330 [Rhinocladiella mackenziei CBS 650.93]